MISFERPAAAAIVVRLAAGTAPLTQLMAELENTEPHLIN